MVPPEPVDMALAMALALPPYCGRVGGEKGGASELGSRAHGAEECVVQGSGGGSAAGGGGQDARGAGCRRPDRWWPKKGPPRAVPAAPG